MSEQSKVEGLGLCDHMKMGVKEEGEAVTVFCYKAVPETEGLALEEMRER